MLARMFKRVVHIDLEQRTNYCGELKLIAAIVELVPEVVV
jgi:hypothetical protein